jgi:hypothetical protein
LEVVVVAEQIQEVVVAPVVSVQEPDYLLPLVLITPLP